MLADEALGPTLTLAQRSRWIDRFVIHGSTSTPEPIQLVFSQLPAPHTSNMVDRSDTSDMPAPNTVPVRLKAATPLLPEDHYAGLAQAVAALLPPTIAAAVDMANTAQEGAG